MSTDAHLIPLTDGRWVCRADEHGADLSRHSNRLDALMAGIHLARPSGGTVLTHRALAASRDLDPVHHLAPCEKHVMEVFAGIALGSVVSLASARLRRTRRKRPPSSAIDREAA